jgi:hypothetical protein
MAPGPVRGGTGSADVEPRVELDAPEVAGSNGASPSRHAGRSLTRARRRGA